MGFRRRAWFIFGGGAVSGLQALLHDCRRSLLQSLIRNIDFCDGHTCTFIQLLSNINLYFCNPRLTKGFWRKCCKGKDNLRLVCFSHFVLLVAPKRVILTYQDHVCPLPAKRVTWKAFNISLYNSHAKKVSLKLKCSKDDPDRGRMGSPDEEKWWLYSGRWRLYAPE